jgi:ATP-dependent 26S proteasome regulatory subunit
MIASASQDWQLANQKYLAIALERVRVALQGYVARSQGKQLTDGMDAGAIAESDTITTQLSPPPTLLSLCSAFHLTAFERDVLVLCAGIELSASIAQLCGIAQGSQQAYPTFSLALAALPEADWSALIPTRPLRRWRLIEVSNGESLTQSRLRIDERVLHHLKGISYLDDRLSGLIQPVFTTTKLPRSHQQLAEQMVELWTEDWQRPPVIQLCGEELAGKSAIAATACDLLGLQLHQLRVMDLPTTVVERETLQRLWEREALFSQSVLLIDCHELDPTLQRAILSFLEAVQSMAIVTGREPLNLQQHPSLRLEVNKPTTAEQRDLWQTALESCSPELNGQLDILVSHFNLSASTIQAISHEFKLQTSNFMRLNSHNETKIQNPDSLWQTCRIQSRTHLEALAQRIQPQATWDDLVLPESQKQTLRDITAQVRQRTIVYETWEFASRSPNGLGISALFAGASGTGKTMAAEVIAQALQLDLYRIDLSQVVSKYIGETEKNLRRVFEAAETGGAILLFDEADALFGKRSEVKDSHDRYANIEVSYLLQRMEAYRGLAILTTNLRSAIDSAFLRRIRFVVQFPFPDAAQRTEIWQRMFPAKLPTEGLDTRKLAQLNVAGGNIRNIALNAAFMAADSGESLQMKHLLRAAQSEYTKLEKTLTDAEARGWV